MSFLKKMRSSTESTDESSADEKDSSDGKSPATEAKKDAKQTGGKNMNVKKTDATSGGGTPGDVKAILGKGSEFEGKLRFEGTARIDGKFTGEVHSQGTLIIGEHAIIEGELNVDGAIISGKVDGDVVAKTRIELHAPAKLIGNLQSPVLIIQEGVIFEGNCQMGKGGGSSSNSSKSTKPAKENGAS